MNEPRLVIERRVAASPTTVFSFFASPERWLRWQVHRDLPGPATEAHRWGWDHYTAPLATVATGGDPDPDPALVAP
jgi:uncharacterized protein YndB with AHSA1/START domain